jgi:presenilin 1
MDDTRMELGVGDFWFYGIFTPRAARRGWDVAILCLIAIVLGLSLTPFALDILRQAMPALPVSLTLGMAAFVVAVIAFAHSWTAFGPQGLSFEIVVFEKISVNSWRLKWSCKYYI